MKFLYKSLLFLMIFICSVGSVCATDTNNTVSLTTFEDNNLQLNNNNTILHTSTNVNNLTDNDNSTVINDSSDLSTVPCAVSSYISVMESYNKTVSVENGIKETHTVNNVTSVAGLVNALTNQGLKCNVIKTKSINDLKPLYNDTNVNVILHMFIKPNYHYAHIKEVKKEGILFNNDLFIRYDVLKYWYTNNTIVITTNNFLNINSFGLSVNKSEWVNITGKLTQRELFNLNYGLIGDSINLNNKYVKLKSKIKDESYLKSIESGEFILFGDTLKPKMANLVKIQGQLKPIYNNPNASPKLLSDLNNILVPMQPNLNDTITGLETLITMINKHCNTKAVKSSPMAKVNMLPMCVDIPKLLGDGCNLFIDNLKESINNLNPLNANPELKEMYDDKYGLEHHQLFGFIDYYTFKK